MSQFHLSQKSLLRLEQVHPRLVEAVKGAIGLSPVDFTVFEGVRSMERQREYVAAGVSKTMESKHLVQDDGFSHAVDLVPIVHGKARWEIEPCIKIAEAMREAFDIGYGEWRLRWGGAWAVIADGGSIKTSAENLLRAYVDRKRGAGQKPFIDGPHFEIVK